MSDSILASMNDLEQTSKQLVTELKSATAEIQQSTSLINPSSPPVAQITKVELSEATFFILGYFATCLNFGLVPLEYPIPTNWSEADMLHLSGQLEVASLMRQMSGKGYFKYVAVKKENPTRHVIVATRA